MIKTIILISVIYLSSFAQINTELISSLNPHPQAGGYNDIWGYTDPSGTEYALLGVRNGFSVISLADPQNPVEVAFFPGNSTLWRDIKVHGSYAYVVADGASEGLKIIDLSQLPDTATLAAVNTNYFLDAHNIFIDNGYAYAIGTEGGGGMHILDLSDPVNPVRTAYYLGSGYIHDVYVWNDTVVACAGYSRTYHLIDVTDKYNPQKISESPFIPRIYAHSGWMTEDKRYFFATDEFNTRDLIIWDLQDRSTWDFKRSIQMPGESNIHNLFIKEDYVYISYYSEGLVIMDIKNPEAPKYAGQYDTYPGQQSGFVGAWGCYPYLPSGNILVSDMQTGLYVVSFAKNSNYNLSPFILHTGFSEITHTDPVLISAVISDESIINQAGVYYRTIINSDTSDWTFVINSNIPQDDTYEFTIPAQPHLSKVQYYIAAVDDSNGVGTLPAGGSGTNPPGNVPPSTFFSYRVVIAGTPIINAFSPATNPTIPKNGKVAFSVSAVDTSKLTLSYLWKRNTSNAGTDSVYNYSSQSFLPAPRTDTITVVVSNGYKTVSKQWLIFVENTTSVDDEVTQLTYSLYQNYPNPFNPSTNIRFTIPESGLVSLSVYNSIGEKVSQLVNEYLPSGEHNYNFSAGNLPSGIYFAKINSGSFNKIIKMTLLK